MAILCTYNIWQALIENKEG